MSAKPPSEKRTRSDQNRMKTYRKPRRNIPHHLDLPRSSKLHVPCTVKVAGAIALRIPRSDGRVECESNNSILKPPHKDMYPPFLLPSLPPSFLPPFPPSLPGNHINPHYPSTARSLQPTTYPKCPDPTSTIARSSPTTGPPRGFYSIL